MDKKVLLDSVKKLREISPKRNFDQTIDISINLANINPKKEEDSVDLFMELPNGRNKDIKVCALVGKELSNKAKIFDKVISSEEFPIFKKDAKKLKKLARGFNFFVAQANLMPEIALTFGKVLGPLGKMPNPKAGCVVPPEAELDPILTKLKSTLHLQTKDQSIIKAIAGSEGMEDDQIVGNIFAVYNSLIHSLPQEKNNIKSVFIKMTMGPPIEITNKGPIIHEKNKKKETKEKKVPTAKELVEKKETISKIEKNG